MSPLKSFLKLTHQSFGTKTHTHGHNQTHSQKLWCHLVLLASAVIGGTVRGEIKSENDVTCWTAKRSPAPVSLRLCPSLGIQSCPRSHVAFALKDRISARRPEAVVGSENEIIRGKFRGENQWNCREQRFSEFKHWKVQFPRRLPDAETAWRRGHGTYTPWKDNCLMHYAITRSLSFCASLSSLCTRVI